MHVTNPSGGFVTCGFISSPMYVSSEARDLPRPNHGGDAGDSSLSLGMTSGALSLSGHRGFLAFARNDMRGRNDAGQSGELPPCEQQGSGGYQNRANNREGPSSGPAGGGKLDARIIPDADLSGLLILASHPVIVAFVIHD